jgi:hypothetical protein
MWYFVFMSFVRPTEQEYANLHHEWKQENLRAGIGEMSLALLGLGMIEVLQDERFQPIVHAWEAALQTTPPQVSEIALESK